MSADKHFYKISRSKKVAVVLFEKIRNRLAAGDKVLWLVSGGSNIQVACQTAELLGDTDLQNLTVCPVDERYGRPGHKDSNWQQLLDAGFKIGAAKTIEVLTGESIEATTERLNQRISRLLQACDYSIALLGLGKDGHIAGIMPQSPAVDAQSSVVSYKYSGYQRITLSAGALVKLDEAVLYAAGGQKRSALERLQNDALPVEGMPAQLIKRIPAWTVYNDVIGEEI